MYEMMRWDIYRGKRGKVYVVKDGPLDEEEGERNGRCGWILLACAEGIFMMSLWTRVVVVLNVVLVEMMSWQIVTSAFVHVAVSELVCLTRRYNKS